MRRSPDRRLLTSLAALVAIVGAAPLLAQLPAFPFPLPGNGQIVLPSLPIIAPPLAAVPADSQEHRSILKEYGGSIAGPQTSVVSSAMAAISRITRPVSPPNGFQVTLLDSPQVNAFAIADGHTYVTRQLLALMNSQEELIGVLGHEAGHVIGRHLLFSGVTRKSQRTGESLLGLVSPDIAARASFAGTLGLRVFDRAQEHHADVTGVKVLADLGLDPRGMYRAIETLEADGALRTLIEGAAPTTSLDYWLRDHPVGRERLGLISLAARGAPRAGGGAGMDRPSFVRSLDGLTFDGGPRDGIARGGAFWLPVARLALVAPPAFALRTAEGALLATGPTGAKALVRWRAGDAPLPAAFHAMWLRERGKDAAVPDAQTRQIGGMEVVFGMARVSGKSGPVDLMLGVGRWPSGGLVELVTVDPGARAAAPLATLLSSIRLMSGEEVAAVPVRRLRVVDPRPGDTVAGLARTMAYDDHREERFRMINGLGAKDALSPGVPVKLVVWNS